jgi:hypothetical protein
MRCLSGLLGQNETFETAKCAIDQGFLLLLVQVRITDGG